MRRDVLQGAPVRGGESREGAHLVDQVGLDLIRARPEGTPAEADEVGEARVGADAHSTLTAHGDRAVHDARVTGVETAGDIGRGEDLEQFFVLTHRVGTEALTDVGDEIDDPSHLRSSHDVVLRARTLPRIPPTRWRANSKLSVSLRASRHLLSTHTLGEAPGGGIFEHRPCAIRSGDILGPDTASRATGSA